MSQKLNPANVHPCPVCGNEVRSYPSNPRITCSSKCRGVYSTKERKKVAFKVCTRCKVKRLSSAFYADKKRPDGLYPYCKDCQRQYAATRVEKQKNARLMWSYKIGIEEYHKMLEAQDHKCAICKKPMDKPHVDHDHTTGFVRGLLCRGCNNGLGNFMDDPSRLCSAIEYLKTATITLQSGKK